MPASANDLLLPWISAVFSETDGQVSLYSLDREHAVTSDDGEELLSFIREDGAALLSLRTDAGVAGFAMTFEDKESARSVFEKTAEPSLIVTDEEGQVTGIYLIADCPERDGLVAEVLEIYTADEDGAFLGSEDVVPVPAGQFRMDDDDAGYVKDGTVLYYSADEIVKAFLPGDDDGEEVETRAEALSELAELDASLIVDEVSDEKFNDAEVLRGDLIPAAFLEQPCLVGTGRDREAKKWPSAETTMFDFINKITTHEVGEKDGLSFIMGTAKANERKKAKMEAMYVVGLDVDCGMPMQEVVERVKKLGVFAVLYSTHSHLSTKSDISLEKFIRWCRKLEIDAEPTPESLSKFLQEVRHYEAGIADTARHVVTDQFDDGMKIIVEHDPMEKYRIMIPLAQPFVFMDEVKRDKITPTEAMERWKLRLRGLAEAIGVPIDESCLDPSRLFYFPRHKKGAAFRAVVIGGKPLVFSEVVESKKGKRTPTQQDVFAQAAERMASDTAGGLRTPEGHSLKGWAKKHADGFQIADVFEAHAEDRIRHRIAEGKIEVECPFDGEHGNPGDEEDRGCFVMNAASDQNDGGFVWKCQHNSCADRDRLDMLHEAIILDWFPEEALKDPQFDPILREEDVQEEEDDEAPPAIDVEAVERTLTTRVKAFNKNTTNREIKAVLTEAHEAEMESFDIQTLVNKIAKQVKDVHAKKDIENLNKTVSREVRATKGLKPEHKDAVEEFIKRYSAKPRPGTKPILLDVLDYDQSKQMFEEVFSNHNKQIGKERVFRFAKEKVRAIPFHGDGEYEIKKLNRPIMREAFWNAATLFQHGEDGPVTAGLTDEQCDMLIESPNLELPVLEGFQTQPYYSKDAELITEKGYNASTKMILRMSKHFEPDSLKRSPTDDDIAEAKEFLLEKAYRDFPFDDAKEGTNGQGSRANFMAMLLMPIVRPLIDGHTPIHFVTKPLRGSGASFLISSALTISTGTIPTTQSQIRDENELRKNITSQFASGRSYIWVDNVNHDISGGVWANLVTSDSWQDRWLGSNDIKEFPNKMQVIVSGNNVGASDEILRRCCPIRLDAKRDPLKRDKSKFAIQEPFEPWVRNNQDVLFQHCLTLVNAWIKANRPLGTGPQLVSFEHWSQVMGGILEVIEIPGFLTNLHLTESVNAERQMWSAICSEWLAKKGFDTKISKSDLGAIYVDMDNKPYIRQINAQADEDEAGSKLSILVDKQKDAIFEIGTDDGVVEVFIRRQDEKGTVRYWLERAGS